VVSLLLVKLDLLHQHFVKDEGVLGTVGVHVHLVEVLLTRSLGLGLFSIEVDGDLDQGFLGDLSLLLPHSEGLFPPTQLHLPRKELLLQLLHCCCHGFRRRGGPTYTKK
jgi:hypothetical protein